MRKQSMRGLEGCSTAPVSSQHHPLRAPPQQTWDSGTSGSL